MINRRWASNIYLSLGSFTNRHTRASELLYNTYGIDSRCRNYQSSSYTCHVRDLSSNHGRSHTKFSGKWSNLSSHTFGDTHRDHGTSCNIWTSFSCGSRYILSRCRSPTVAMGQGCRLYKICFLLAVVKYSASHLNGKKTVFATLISGRFGRGVVNGTEGT